MSYLGARSASDTLVLARQEITRGWWQRRRNDFIIFASKLVWDEASVGHPDAVRKRLRIIRPLPWLQFKREAAELADALLHGPVPQKAADDAAHIALATIHKVHFLLTWNCTHINNAEITTEVREICREFGYECPVICTPEELTGD